MKYIYLEFWTTQNWRQIYKEQRQSKNNYVIIILLLWYLNNDYFEPCLQIFGAKSEAWLQIFVAKTDPCLQIFVKAKTHPNSQCVQ